MLFLLVRPHLWAMPVLVVLGLLASAAEGFGIGMLIPLLDALMQDALMQGEEQVGASNWFVDAIRNYGAGLSQETRLVMLVGTIFGLAFAKSGIVSVYAALSAWFNTTTIHVLRCALFGQLLDVGYGFFMRTDRGRLLNTVDGETWRTGEALSSLAMLTVHACGVLSLGVILLLISWQMTLTVVAGVVLVTLFLRLMVRCARRLGDASVSSYARLSERLLESLSAMRVIRLFGREAYERERFERASDRARRDTLNVDVATAVVQPVSELLYVLLFIGVLLAWHRTVELGTLLAFLLLLYRLQPHIKGFDYHRVQFASLLAAVTEVSALLDPQDKPYIRSGSRRCAGLREAITYRDVSFRYDDEGNDTRSALTDVSCMFRRNEMTALVGASGAGKSTLIALLCRLYDPVEGEILIDGVPLRELDLAAWRRRLAFAGQDLELMADTILDNIAYGRPDADREAIIAATRQADAYNFIMSLPEGLDTRVGEHGLRLSAGQRQRVSLSRALLRDPDILILDEATNAIDSLSEKMIQQTLERLSGRLTIIVIAHRLSTTRLANRVVVLNEGRVVEQGRPDELLAGNSLFTRLWELQAGALGEKVEA